MRPKSPYLVGGGRIERTAEVMRLVLPPCSATQYSDAQLDDYGGESGFVFANNAPLSITLHARFSHPIGQLRGTAGFGFWNHPFVAGGGTIPRSLWFFNSSNDSDLQFARGVAGYGFKAALLDALPIARARNSHSSNISKSANAAPTNAPDGLLFKAAALVTRQRWLMALAIRAAQRVFHAREKLLDLDITEWHEYVLEWRHHAVVWRIDGAPVFQAKRPPAGPLGFVAWIDNYRAQFTIDGRYEFAYAATSETQWLDLKLGH